MKDALLLTRNFDFPYRSKAIAQKRFFVLETPVASKTKQIMVSPPAWHFSVEDTLQSQLLCQITILHCLSNT